MRLRPRPFKRGVQLVQVRVVAEDKDGKPVTDLRQEEFQLLDNGLSQDIRLFLNESERLERRTPRRSRPARSPTGANPGPASTADIR